LIHISELSDDRVEHPRDVVNKGDKLTLRVVKVDVKNRRLGLSLRRVNSAEFLDEDLRRAYRDAEENVQFEDEDIVIDDEDDDDMESDYEAEMDEMPEASEDSEVE